MYFFFRSYANIVMSKWKCKVKWSWSWSMVNSLINVYMEMENDFHLNQFKPEVKGKTDQICWQDVCAMLLHSGQTWLYTLTASNLHVSRWSRTSLWFPSIWHLKLKYYKLNNNIYHHGIKQLLLYMAFCRISSTEAAICQNKSTISNVKCDKSNV